MESPAFQFYVQDFLTGTRFMSAEEVGGYILLLCYQWDKGALPNDDAVLRRISHVRPKALKNIKPKFTIGEDLMLRNIRLEKEREKQVCSREGRRAGAFKRWHPDEVAPEQSPQLQIDHVLPVARLDTAHLSSSKKIRLGREQYDISASELMWERCAESITELMAGTYRSLKVKDIFAEVDSSCPTGTVFNNVAHLLNKFKAVANAMIVKKNAPPRRQDAIVASSRPPIVNL